MQDRARLPSERFRGPRRTASDTPCARAGRGGARGLHHPLRHADGVLRGAAGDVLDLEKHRERVIECISFVFRILLTPYKAHYE